MKWWRERQLERYLPVGYDAKYEVWIFLTGMVLSFMWGCLYFRRLYVSWERLWELEWKNGEMVRGRIIEGVVMRDFSELFFRPNSLAGFFIVILCMVAFMLMHYVYHFQESKSIYVMRRLPDKKELYRRCFTLPLVGIGGSFISAVLFLLLGYVVYMNVTPPECIAGDQWQKIWGMWML